LLNFRYLYFCHVLRFDLLIEKGKEQEVHFEKLNIQPEHVHALINLPTDRTLSKFMNMLST